MTAIHIKRLWRSNQGDDADDCLDEPECNDREPDTAVGPPDMRDTDAVHPDG